MQARRAELMYQRSMIAEVDEDSEDEDQRRSRVRYFTNSLIYLEVD
jgi:hypothetical protein